MVAVLEAEQGHLMIRYALEASRTTCDRDPLIGCNEASMARGRVLDLRKMPSQSLRRKLTTQLNNIIFLSFAKASTLHYVVLDSRPDHCQGNVAVAFQMRVPRSVATIPPPSQALMMTVRAPRLHRISIKHDY